jgi:hypothetical protein
MRLNDERVVFGNEYSGKMICCGSHCRWLHKKRKPLAAMVEERFRN